VLGRVLVACGVLASCGDRVPIVTQRVGVVDGAVMVHLPPSLGGAVVGEHPGGADVQGDGPAGGIGELAGLPAGEHHHVGALELDDVAEGDLHAGGAVEDALVEPGDLAAAAEDAAERVVQLHLSGVKC
jgi:hypothetical protein